MSVRLVSEVIAYLNRKDCPLTPAERLVLVVVAERARDEGRMAWQGGQDDWSLSRILGVRLSDVLDRLAKRGLDVRVVVATDAAGRPVYAHRGRQASFRLPTLPENGSVVADPNAEKGSVPADPNSGDGSAVSQKGSAQTEAFQDNGSATTDPNAKKGSAGTEKGSAQPENGSAVSQKGSATTDPYPYIINHQKQKPTSIATSPRQREPSPAPDDPAFEAFWAAYPRKIAKATARKAWTKAVKAGAAPDILTTAARRYAAARRGQDPHYTAHPSTWLNGERWHDQPDPTPAPPSSHQHPPNYFRSDRTDNPFRTGAA